MFASVFSPKPIAVVFSLQVVNLAVKAGSHCAREKLAQKSLTKPDFFIGAGTEGSTETGLGCSGEKKLVQSNLNSTLVGRT